MQSQSKSQHAIFLKIYMLILYIIWRSEQFWIVTTTLKKTHTTWFQAYCKAKVIKGSVEKAEGQIHTYSSGAEQSVKK